MKGEDVVVEGYNEFPRYEEKQHTYNGKCIAIMYYLRSTRLCTKFGQTVPCTDSVRMTVCVMVRRNSSDD